MIAILCKVVIGTRDVDILSLMRRRRENESLVVWMISVHIDVRVRQRFEVAHRSQVRPCVNWIHLLQLLKSEGEISHCRRVGLTAVSLHREARTTGTLRWVGTEILQDTIAHRGAWNDLRSTHTLLRPPRALIVHEKEQAILLQRAAEGSSKNIANQLGSFIA